MFALSSENRFHLFSKPTDMRKSFDGLSGLVQNTLERNPSGGDVFIFINKRRDKIKLLHWQGASFVLYYKRLEKVGRADTLFGLYPDIKQAYWLVHGLRMIFTNTKDKGVAYTKMAKWFNDVTDSGFKSFNTISAIFYSHYPEILNYFDNRSTNASAESFNAKIKAFRATQRGVRDIPFFLFRLAKIYA